MVYGTKRIIEEAHVSGLLLFIWTQILIILLL